MTEINQLIKSNQIKSYQIESVDKLRLTLAVISNNQQSKIVVRYRKDAAAEIVANIQNIALSNLKSSANR